MTRRSQRRSGYTLIEAMMAVAILMVGSVGIFAMQQAATAANVEARQMTIASNAARTWAERIRRDALNWTTSGGGVALARTDYLKDVPAGVVPGPWFTPVPPAARPQESYGFDWYGQDTLDAAATRYCTNMQLQWLVPNQAIRANIRVWYVRNRTGDAGLAARCVPGFDAGPFLGPPVSRPLKAVFLTTVVHWYPT